MTTVSLIVSTYNWKEALALTLRSIAAQRVLPLEVIVADDGSRADTGEMIREMAKDFPVRAQACVAGGHRFPRSPACATSGSRRAAATT